jgi:hypothetical protein
MGRRFTTEELASRQAKAQAVRDKLKAGEQFTLQDVTDAGDPQDVLEAMNAGLLVTLGYGKPRRPL